MEHLVYCDAKAKVLEKILNGTKTMIIRGAAGRKLPYGRVVEGEPLYFIENDGSGLIKAKATVESVFNSDKLREDESTAIVAKNQERLDLTDLQIKRWAGKRVLCLVGIKDVEKLARLSLNAKATWMIGLLWKISHPYWKVQVKSIRVGD